MGIEIAICLLSFATVSLFVLGIAMKSEHSLIRERMQAYKLSLPEDYEMLAPELKQSFGERVIRPWVSRFMGLLARAMPSTAAAGVELKLQRAGDPFKLTAPEFLGIKTLTIVVCGAAGIALFFLSTQSQAYIRVLELVIGFVVGITLPDYLLDNAIKERQMKIRKALPDTLDLLVVSAEAGLGFDAAVARVVEKVKGPIADEFKKVLDEMQIGRSRIEALKSMANRVGTMELTTFAAAIYQADLLGVSIAHVLRVQAETLRSQRNIRAREAAAKMPVKMLFPLVFFIFPAIFVVILGPGAIQIFQALGLAGK